MMRPISLLVTGLLLPWSVAAAGATDAVPFDPVTVDLADVIACKIDGGHYTGFAMTISSGGARPGSAKARGWVKLPVKSPFFSAYRLPKPLSIFGNSTSTLAFTGSALFAVLDLPDATALGAELGIANSFEGSGQFKGELIIDESTSTDKETGYRFKNRSALQIATNPAFPGKTLVGCHYNGELQLPAS